MCSLLKQYSSVSSRDIIEEMTLLCLFWIITLYYCITMFISKIDFLEQRSTISFTDDLRRCHECRESSIFRKISWKIRVTLFSEVQASHVHDPPLTSRRRPKKTGDDDRRHTSTMTTRTNNDGSHTTTNLR